jgi:hypothetical protein
MITKKTGGGLLSWVPIITPRPDETSQTPGYDCMANNTSHEWQNPDRAYNSSKCKAPSVTAAEKHKSLNLSARHFPNNKINFIY